MNDLREAYSKAVKAHNENPSDATMAEVIRTAKAAATWIKDDEGNGADTFRDHDPVERIHHDYEVWDRHHG